MNINCNLLTAAVCVVSSWGSSPAPDAPHPGDGGGDVVVVVAAVVELAVPI